MDEQRDAHKVVGFDLDGVIIDHTQNKILFARRYGVELTPERTHAEIMGWYLSPDAYKEIKGQIYDHSPEALKAPLMEGAHDALLRAKSAGVPFYLVSLQKNPMHALHLLEERGLWGQLFTPENTYFARDRAEKHRIAHMLGVTDFVDDEPGVLDVMERIPHRILFDPRNIFRHEKEFIPARSWSDILTHIGVGY